MRRIFTATVTAGLAAVALGGLAYAQPPGPASDTPRVSVSYGDLNLSSASGRAQLARRIASAASALCGQAPGIRDLAATQAYRGCITATVASSAPSVEQAALQQTRSMQQLAQGGNH